MDLPRRTDSAARIVDLEKERDQLLASLRLLQPQSPSRSSLFISKHSCGPGPPRRLLLLPVSFRRNSVEPTICSRWIARIAALPRTQGTKKNCTTSARWKRSTQVVDDPGDAEKAPGRERKPPEANRSDRASWACGWGTSRPAHLGHRSAHRDRPQYQAGFASPTPHPSHRKEKSCAAFHQRLPPLSGAPASDYPRGGYEVMGVSPRSRVAGGLREKAAEVLARL